ncbi:PREDICTED: uncharacterized protein C16orf46 homolog [Elephantulus edwardii]|uniref:uncharacterized protein C16orf46 homolog n=1 Tax=Elephantulus edwardii TaxID=28737 RepID=UPI0003F0C2C7|nr:PREDICTED: uncharacterized protein C16orf46 homolog [Elephantulus edwardii]
MDLGGKSEADLENNEEPGTKETAVTPPCPDESSERNPVCSLLSISDLTLQQDEKVDFVIGTGWEEAVQGWGSTSPMACIWPRKKVKKARVGENTSTCLVCVNIMLATAESRPQAEPGKPESRAAAGPGPAEAGPGAGKDLSSPSQGPCSPQGHSAACREISKPCFPHQSHSEKKSLQIKEYIWCTDNLTAPNTLKGKDPRDQEHFGASVDRSVSVAGSLTSKALLVLPPLRASLPNSLDTLGKKNKNVFLQQEGKGLSEEQGKGVACPCELKNGDEKCERRSAELAKHPRVKHLAPVPASVPRPALLAHTGPCYLRWALLPERNLLCPPTPANLSYLTTLHLLQKQGMQSYRPKFKTKELRPPGLTHRHILRQAKQENRPQMLDTKVFSRPLLPSVTVSRVAIPVSSYTLL